MKNQKINTLINKKKINKKIMIVGNFKWFWYQEACALALEKLGCSIHRFKFFNDFEKRLPGRSEPVYLSFWHYFQYRFHIGPIIWKTNDRLITCALREKPDIIWFYNVQLIKFKTIIKLKKLLPNATLVQYANDNPFSSKAKKGVWNNFLKSIHLFHIHFAYRLKNISDFKKYGAKSTHLLRSYFIPEEDYPINYNKIPEKFKCDVVFAGHYENDGRIEILEEICKAGYKLNLFGGGWNKVLKNLDPKSPLKDKFPTYPVTKKDYRYAISGAKVALCFLSKINLDTYTRRNFQIPAMKTAMLSEWSKDLASLFTENKDCLFFRDKKSLLKKLNKLISDKHYRKRIARSGFKKVHNENHDIISRMNFFLKKINTKIN